MEYSHSHSTEPSQYMQQPQQSQYMQQPQHTMAVVQEKGKAGANVMIFGMGILVVCIIVVLLLVVVVPGFSDSGALAPVNPTLAPVNPTLVPVNPTLAPVNPTLAPVNPTLVPVNPDPDDLYKTYNSVVSNIEQFNQNWDHVIGPDNQIIMEGLDSEARQSTYKIGRDVHDVYTITRSVGHSYTNVQPNFTYSWWSVNHTENIVLTVLAFTLIESGTNNYYLARVGFWGNAPNGKIPFDTLSDIPCQISFAPPPYTAPYALTRMQAKYKVVSIDI